MNDLDYLQQIETELKIKFEQTDKKHLEPRQFVLENGRITKINFPQITLKQLPSIILKLTELTDLSFWVEQFPEGLDSLKKLKELHFGGIETYPNEIGNMPQLEELSFTLRFSLNPQVPPWLDKFPQITELTIFFPEHIMLPVHESIGELTRLKKLYLFGAFILPESFGNLKNLISITIKESQFQLPESFGKLESLREMQIYNTNLQHFPESIGNLKNLVNLDACNNKLETLPLSIGDCSALKYLDLSDNEIVALPISIGNCKQLCYLCVDHNHLNSIPSQIGQLWNLRDFDISFNEIIRIPEEISNCRSLESLNLNDNPLTNLPVGLGRIASLNFLDISNTLIRFISPLFSRNYIDEFISTNTPIDDETYYRLHRHHRHQNPKSEKTEKI